MLRVAIVISVVVHKIVLDHLGLPLLFARAPPFARADKGSAAYSTVDGKALATFDGAAHVTFDSSGYAALAAS